MRVLIAGGTGLIGTRLCAELAADGNEVMVLSRTPERAQGLPDGVRAVGWDAKSVAGWGELAGQVDAVVNLVGASIAGGWWTAERKKLLYSSRIDPGRLLVQAIESVGTRPRVLIQSSGIGYYGFGGDELIDESDPPGEDFLAQLAVDWEASTAEVEALGVRRAITRSGAVLSTAGGALSPMLLQTRLFVGGPVGRGTQWLPWIHITDQVRAIRFLIDNDQASGPFNLVAPHNLTNAEFSRVLARVLKRPSFIRAPAFALRLVLGELSSVLLEGQRAMPRRLQDLGFEFSFPDAKMALMDLVG